MSARQHELILFFKKSTKYLLFVVPVILFLFLFIPRTAKKDVIGLFPLKNYDQNISTWINSSNPNFDKPLMSPNVQQKKLSQFYDHYFGSLSPWDENHVTQLFQKPDDSIKQQEETALNVFNNEKVAKGELGYGENFRPYDKHWIKNIATNMNIAQFDKLTWSVKNRGIAVENIAARTLPTDDPYFYSYKEAGQGFPFDMMQESAIWLGTPVYIIGETRDHMWFLITTPEYITWVHSRSIARVDTSFVATWKSTAKKSLAAITHTQTSLFNDEGKFLFQAYVGTVLPIAKITDKGMNVMVPVARENQQAISESSFVSFENATVMPLSATPKHFASIMQTLIGRPYGWGNLNFNNDCSAELKSLFTPFGIWLPRNSSQQADAGVMVDMTSASLQGRLNYLMKNGQPFMTLVYIGGHIMLYIGNYNNPREPGSWMPMTYQDMWGLSPSPPDRRAIIGKSVLFPLLQHYPEDPSLTSPAGKKYFKVIFLQ